MPISVRLYSLGYNLLYVFVGRFYRTIHLGPVRHWIVMLYLELGAHLCHHVIVQIKPIVGYYSLRKSISTYDFFLDESGYHWLLHAGIRCCLYPLGKVIDDYENEAVTVLGLRGYRLDYINAPHWERPWWHHYVQGCRRNMYLVCVDLTFMAFSDVVDAIVL